MPIINPIGRINITLSSIQKNPKQSPLTAPATNIHNSPRSIIFLILLIWSCTLGAFISSDMLTAIQFISCRLKCFFNINICSRLKLWLRRLIGCKFSFFNAGVFVFYSRHKSWFARNKQSSTVGMYGQIPAFCCSTLGVFFGWSFGSIELV